MSSDPVGDFVSGIDKTIGDAKSGVDKTWGDIKEGVDKTWGDIKEGITKIVGTGATILTNAWRNICEPIVEKIFAFFGYTDQDIYYTALQTQPIFGEYTPDTLRLAVLSAVRHDQDIIETLKLAMLTGAPSTVRRYIQFGKADYIHGLPSMRSGYRIPDEDAADAVLETIEGQAITITYIKFGYADEEVYVKYYLQQNYGYTEDDNYISLNGNEWTYNGYTKNMDNTFTVHMIDPVALGQHTGGNNEAVLQDSFANWNTDEWVGATLYNLSDSSSGTVTANTATTITCTLAGGTDNDWDTGDLFSIGRTDAMDLSPDIAAAAIEAYYSVKYELDADPSYTKYFSYKVSTGTYPTLIAVDDAAEYNQADMIPIVPLVTNFTAVNVNNQSPDHPYHTSKQILDILGIGIDSLIDSLQDSPDYDKVSDAFVVFGVNIYSTHQAEMQLLYDMFTELYFTSPISKAEYELKFNTAAQPPFNAFYLEEQYYDVAIQYNYITVNFYFSNMGGALNPKPNGYHETEHVILANTDPDEEGNMYGGVNSYMLLRKQTDNGYFEIKVHGLAMTVILRTTNNRFKANIIEMTADTTDPAYANFTIPFPGRVFDATYNYRILEDLAFRTPHVVVCAAEHVHLEWYETPAFLSFVSIVIQIAAIVYLAYTWDAEGGVTLWSIAQALLVQVALRLILNRLLVLYGDNQAARYLIYAAYIAASAYAAGQTDLLSAETLLFAVNGLVQVATIELSLEQAELEAEIEEFTKEAEERREEIEAAQALLAKTKGLSPWEIVTYMPFDVYETPSDYYERTTHNTNPGVLCLDQIENYHDNLLRLPELDLYSFNTQTVHHLGSLYGTEQ